MRCNRGRDGAVIVFAEEERSVVYCVCLCVFAYVCKRERLFMCVLVLKKGYGRMKGN